MFETMMRRSRAGAHGVADDLLHPADQSIRQFQSCSGRRLQIDHELAGIGAGKVGFTDPGKEREARDEESGDAEDRGEGTEQCPADGSVIPIEEAMKSTLEFCAEPRAPAAGRSGGAFGMMGAVDKPGAKERNDRHRHQVGGGQ